MTIPFPDLKATYLELRDELDAAYRRVMESGWYLLGAELEAFEAEFAAYCGSRHCIGVANGLEALHLPGFSLTYERVQRGAFAAAKIDVQAEEHPPARHWAEIQALISP